MNSEIPYPITSLRENGKSGKSTKSTSKSRHIYSDNCSTCSANSNMIIASNSDSEKLIWNKQIQQGPLSHSHCLAPQDTYHQHVQNPQHQVHRTKQAVQRQELYQEVCQLQFLHTARKLDLPAVTRSSFQKTTKALSPKFWIKKQSRQHLNPAAVWSKPCQTITIEHFGQGSHIYKYKRRPVSLKNSSTKITSNIKPPYQHLSFEPASL